MRKKLQKMAELLLDIGKRNNLINFKDSKASTAEILLPKVDAFFQKLTAGAVFELFEDKIAQTSKNSRLPPPTSRRQDI